MSDSDRHINFKLMRDHILSLQDSETPRTGKKYWRSLEELADTPVFKEFVAREFPQQAEGWNDPFERRTFLKLMGASLALAGLSGCVFQPPEKIVPYVNQPEDQVPGKALFFATAAPLLGAAIPVLVRSNEGRPTKIEGNPEHPNNRPLDFPPDDPIRDARGSSATDIFAQASILGLYDPDRSQTLTFREDIRTWTAFVGEMRSKLDEQRPKQGAGIRFLTETIISPTLAAQMKELLTALPQAKWHQYEPANRDNVRAGAVMAFGQPVNTTYRFDQAQRILSLDCDFLSPTFPGNLRYSREFIGRRRVTEKNRDMNRLYVVETTPSNTGAMADHVWTVKPSDFYRTALAIAFSAEANLNLNNFRPDSAEAWIAHLAHDLQQHRGSSIVLAGDNQPPVIHALAHAMNNALGNVGKTVFYTDPIEANSVDQRESLQDLVNDIDAGRVELLVIVGGNPVYNTPADLKLDFERLEKAKLRVHLSEYKDETTQFCHWHVPAAHYLESWGDTRSYDGTVTIMQPLIEPLHEGKSAHELLAVFSDQYDRKPYEIVKTFWQTQGRSGAGSTGAGAGRQGQAGAAPSASPAPAQPAPAPVSSPTADFESFWRQSIHDGFVANSAFPTKTVSLNPAWASQAPVPAPQPASGFELVFRTDPSIHDGRFANNGWLQELPKPLTKVTWDNVAIVSPHSAQQLVNNGTNRAGTKGREHYVPLVDLVDQQNRTLLVPLWIMPGQPDGVITIHLGYGRRLAGRVGSGTEAEPIGFDAYSLRTAAAPWSTSGIQVRSAGRQYLLATTQLHFNLEDPNFAREERDILRSETLDHFLHGEKHEEHQLPTLYPPDYNYKDQAQNAPNYAWGMAIDLNNCIGCNACTIACQSENNIPVVGKKEVVRSREMHWIRLDTYFRGFDPSHPEGTNFMPVPCMHCENAPCEPVCPVHATVHSAEGLNDMVYNRCVGTKYCSNNCPYKVRRFNFFLYQDWDTPTYQLMRNPDVSVRSRGVMEKCTYCVQRIQSGKIQAELEDRKLRDGEVVTACQAVCPTEAIVFGDINDPNSRVSKLKADERNYSLLGELNTIPRTTYLTHLKNPNPEIKPGH
ncbi:MAG TPA: TAT-variant-translocated molybdopterin oxidoreductase [Pyrinomonadaceae bacterium]|nr:TAT-variant-translocated molybdopterin oxidoreductase [Pyrinomonadaceae bacterium]